MQQCKFVYTITRADCRACNGLDAGCRNYEPNPEPKAWRCRTRCFLCSVPWRG